MWAMVPHVGAQEPKFEVASVKPISKATVDTQGHGGWRFSADTTYVNAEYLSTIIAMSYEVNLAVALSKIDFSKIPRALFDEQFEIIGKGDPKGDRLAMMRTLLAERFGLRVHRETRIVPMFELVQAKKGSKLRPTATGCIERARVRIEQRAQGIEIPRLLPECTNHHYAGTIDTFILLNLAARVRIPVVNHTGLQGNFEWKFGGVIPLESLSDALEDQLGLKLQRTKGPYEVIVIDALREPTPN